MTIHPLLEQLMSGDTNRRRPMWIESLGHPGYAAWVVDADGELVGFVDLFVLPDVAHGFKIALISTLVVDEGFVARGSANGC